MRASTTTAVDFNDGILRIRRARAAMFASRRAAGLRRPPPPSKWDRGDRGYHARFHSFSSPHLCCTPTFECGRLLKHAYANRHGRL